MCLDKEERLDGQCVWINRRGWMGSVSGYRGEAGWAVCLDTEERLDGQCVWIKRRGWMGSVSGYGGAAGWAVCLNTEERLDGQCVWMALVLNSSLEISQSILGLMVKCANCEDILWGEV